jgi:hypothetical protein
MYIQKEHTNMAKVRAKDTIRLTTGEVLTLAAALDTGKVYLDTYVTWTRDTDAPREVRQYVARDAASRGAESWDVGQKLYESRQR